MITGVSSGFGRLMTELALKNGDKVAATLRKPEAISDLIARYPTDRLFPIQLDVTKREQVKDVFAAALAHFGRIDIVFNNAGWMALGELEGTGDADARTMFEVNFWGATYVTQESLRVFREENKPQGGRLLQASSITGVIGFAGNGFYSATKFALEGLSEAAMNELDPAWNIKISLIEFGAFRTKLMGDNVKIAPHHPAYDNQELAGWKAREWITGPNVTGDAAKAVIVVDKLSRLENPPHHLVLTKQAIALSHEKLRDFSESLREYESWSEDLEVDE